MAGCLVFVVFVCILSESGGTLPNLPDKDMTVDEAITTYFNAGYTYSVILSLLVLYQNTRISLSKLKRALRAKNLRRRKVLIPEESLMDAIRNELSGPGSLSGYRDMWQTLRQDYGVNVPRDKVMELLKRMDPAGTNTRKRNRLQRRRYRSKGPNYVWHLDGYDKLRPYGFEIHGCIDGYSRRIMWLEVGSTNKDSEIVCGYYVKCIHQLKACPRVVRTDPGTENVLISSVQCTLRRNDEDDLAGFAAHRYGKSVFNQRIEAWWSFYKRNRSQWWIELFRDLIDFGALDVGNTFHIRCLRFCFMDIIQEDLDRVANKWNHHKIRPTRTAESPHGVPNVLYMVPEQTGSQNYGITLSEEDITWAESLSKTSSSRTGDEDADAFLEETVQGNLKIMPSNWIEAIELYFSLWKHS